MPTSFRDAPANRGRAWLSLATDVCTVPAAADGLELGLIVAAVEKGGPKSLAAAADLAAKGARMAVQVSVDVTERGPGESDGSAKLERFDLQFHDFAPIRNPRFRRGRGGRRCAFHGLKDTLIERIAQDLFQHDFPNTRDFQ